MASQVKSYIEQTTASTESVEQVTRIETELARLESIIVRAEQKIEKAESSTGNPNDDINAQIEKEQQRRSQRSYKNTTAIDEQQNYRRCPEVQMLIDPNP